MFDFSVHPKDINSQSGFLFIDGVRFYYSFYCNNEVQAVGVQAEIVVDNVTQYSNAITISSDNLQTSVYYFGAY